MALFPDDEEEAERAEEEAGVDAVTPKPRASLRGASFLHRLQALHEKISRILFKRDSPLRDKPPPSGTAPTTPPVPEGGWLPPAPRLPAKLVRAGGGLGTLPSRRH